MLNRSQKKEAVDVSGHGARPTSVAVAGFAAICRVGTMALGYPEMATETEWISCHR